MDRQSYSIHKHVGRGRFRQRYIYIYICIDFLLPCFLLSLPPYGRMKTSPPFKSWDCPSWNEWHLAFCINLFEFYLQQQQQCWRQWQKSTIKTSFRWCYKSHVRFAGDKRDGAAASTPRCVLDDGCSRFVYFDDSDISHTCVMEDTTLANSRGWLWLMCINWFLSTRNYIYTPYRILSKVPRMDTNI
jgi:hypothetical protein